MIRDARLADAPVLADLLTELGYPSTADQIRDRLGRIGADGGRIVVAERDGAVAGCLHVSAATNLTADRGAEIQALVVAAGARGSGIGRALVDAARAWALERGCRDLRVRTNVVRSGARAFYARLGFAPTKEQVVFVLPLPRR